MGNRRCLLQHPHSLWLISMNCFVCSACRRVDRVMDITQIEAEETMRAAARVEGIFAGVSSGGSLSAALRLSAEVQNAIIVAIVCDRGDRYLSTGCFAESAAAKDPQPCRANEFWSAAARLPHAYPGPHYVLFTQDPDPATGDPACPETRRRVHAVREAVAKRGGTLLEVSVGTREEWDRPYHPFKTHEMLGLKEVPTVMRWGVNGPDGILDIGLAAAPSAEAAATLIERFVASQRL